MHSSAGMVYGEPSAESAFVEKLESDVPGTPLVFVVFWRPRPFVPKRITSLVAAMDVISAEQLTAFVPEEAAVPAATYFSADPLAQ